MQQRKTIKEVQENLENAAERLKEVSSMLDKVIVGLRAIQHARLQKMVTEQDLKEARTIKELIAEIESVA